MRILYGVTGEGLGHAMRSRVVGEHLRARGHQVKFVASGRAGAYLARHFDDVQPIVGLQMVHADGAVRRLRTVAGIGRSARPAVKGAAQLFRRAIAGFQPDVCVSDFDSFSHLFGRLFDRPVISLDHQHVIDRFFHPRDVTRRLPRDFALTRAIVRAKMPGCRHYLVTSFFFPAHRPGDRARTTLVGPILRPEVLALAPRAGDHVLVYQTALASADLLDVLGAIRDHRFVVYHRGDAAIRGNVELCRFDEPRFLEHLASARAVICNAGYTLLAEALYLGKPVLAIPVRHQGEQELNAAYLAALGFGRALRTVDATAIRRFADDAPAPLPVPAGNRRALDALDTLLEEAA